MFAFGAAFIAASFLTYGHLPRIAINPPQVHPIVIDYSPGGLIRDHMRFFWWLQASGTPVQIQGPCISACTLVLTLPKSQVCVGPKAKLGFHLITNLADGMPLVADTADFVKAQYPKQVRDWIEENGPLKAMPIYMDAKTIVELGVFPACKD